MRVCIFGSEIGPVKKEVFVGGAAVSAVRLGRALHALGDKVFVFSSAPRGKFSKIYAFDWGVVVNKRIPGRYASLPYMFIYGMVSFFGLLRFCKQNEIEVINSHSGSIILCVVPGFVGKFFRIPVVHTQYCELSAEGTGLDKFFGRFVTKLCSSLIAKFCGISKNVCVSLMRAGVQKQKIETIPPVVPSVEKNVRPEKKYRVFLGFDDADLVALFVGNLKKNKGIDVLFEAFIKLVVELPSLKLIVTTELAHEGFVERKRILQDKLRQHGLADKVVWLSFVDDMLSLIKEADVLVVPFLDLRGISDYPLVVLEAMSVGTPVVATEVGGIREILGKEDGILVPPGDVEALCLRLKNVLTNKQRNWGGVKNLPSSCFDASSVGRRYQELYRQVVGKSG